MLKVEIDGREVEVAHGATVMEAATGERFDRLMRRLVFEPMGLKAGFYLADFAPAKVDDVATLYRKREKDGDEAWDPKGPWIAQSDDFGNEIGRAHV